MMLVGINHLKRLKRSTIHSQMMTVLISMAGTLTAIQVANVRSVLGPYNLHYIHRELIIVKAIIFLHKKLTKLDKFRP